MVKRIFLVFLALLLILILPTALYAQKGIQKEQIELPKVEVQVDHVANIFEKLKEKITFFFKFSKKDKFNYQKFILEKRLAELKYVVDSKEWQPIEETSSRYATYLGKFNEFVLKSNLGNKKEEILKVYDRHGKILEELQRNFKFESGWWLLLQHDINSTKIFSEQIKSL